MVEYDLIKVLIAVSKQTKMLLQLHIWICVYLYLFKGHEFISFLYCQASPSDDDDEDDYYYCYYYYYYYMPGRDCVVRELALDS